MSIFSIFGTAFAWLKKEFSNLSTKVAPIVVTILSALQAAENTGFVDAIASVLDHVTGGLSDKINAAIKANINKAIAVALAVEAPPDPATATAADIAAWEQKVLTAIGGSALAIKGQLWDTIGAQLYIELQEIFAAGASAPTFGQIVTDIEKAFLQYTADQAAAQQAAS